MNNNGQLIAVGAFATAGGFYILGARVCAATVLFALGLWFLLAAWND